MNRTLIALSLALSPLLGTAAMAEETLTQGEWQLIALDGARIDYRASFAMDAEDKVSGQAPCNRYFGQNQASAPALSLQNLGVTRMACDALAAEQVFLTALSAMTAADLQGENLILSNETGRSLEFVRDPGAKALICRSCGD